MLNIALVRCRENDIFSDQAQNEELILGYSSSILEEAGFPSRIFDFCLDTSITNTDLLEFAPDLLVVVLRRPGENFEACSSFIRSIKTYKKWTGHITIIGKSINGLKRILSESLADSVIIGEEYALVSLVRSMKDKSPVSTLPGIAYMDSLSKEIRINKPSSFEDLDYQPFPKRYLFENLKQCGINTSRLKAIIESSRGCYAQCNFCCLTAFHQNGVNYLWRGRSAHNIVEEIKCLVADYGLSDFLFYDSNFFGPGKKGRERVKEIAEQLIATGLDIKFTIYSRADDLDLEIVRLLKKAGLVKIFLGIESLNQQALDRYNKKILVEENLNAIEICKQLDIYMHLSFITFDYDTSVEEIRENISKLKASMESKPYLFQSFDFVHNSLRPLDDTPIAKEYLQRGVTQSKNELNLFSTYVFSDPRVISIAKASKMLSNEIYRLNNDIYQKFSKILEDPQNKTDEIHALFYWQNSLPILALNIFEDLLNELAITNYNPDVDKILERHFQLLYERAQPL